MRRLWERMAERLRQGDDGSAFELEGRLDQLLSRSEPPSSNWHERHAVEERLQDLLNSLSDSHTDSATLELQERVVTARWSGDPHIVGQRYELFQRIFLRVLPQYLWNLHQAGRLDVQMFRRAVTLVPLLFSVLPYSGDSPRWLEKELTPEAILALRGFTRLLIDGLVAQPLDDATAELVALAAAGYWSVGAQLEGADFLLVAAREHARHELGKLKLANSYNKPAIYRAVLEMARGAAPQPDNDLEDLAAQLKNFPAATLKALLPITHPGLRDALLQPLEWDDARGLVALLGAGEGSKYGQQQSIRNSPDPENGVVNVEAAHAAFAAVGQKRAREVLKLFRSGNTGLGNEITLLEAVQGWNRTTIIERLERRNQVSVKAYGLLPLENGEDEVLERYLWLQEFGRQSNQFGAQRQNSERAAVQVALANLAQVAGFGDVQRLEWRMAVLLGSEQLAPGRVWEADPYRIILEIDEDKPSLVVYRGERRLKSIPQAVRQHPDYESMKETVKALRQQASHLRTVLEESMACGAYFSAADMETLLQLPVARSFLSGLILRTGEGRFGLFEADSGMLRSLEGERFQPVAPLSVAHPYHLERSGVLGAWQRAIVRQRLVQPFKQAFRELYVLTPAEEETATYSNRFANQQVDSAQAHRLFQSRDWVLPQDEYSVPNRPFAEYGIRACFDFADIGHYFSEAETITSRTIFFERHPLPPGVFGGTEEARVPLAEVPPVEFSEVMRDADLIVSVAQWTEERAAARAAQRAEQRARQQAQAEAAWRRSEEAYRRRGELVAVLLEDLAIEGVRIEGHFAYVNGKLADYRVHLGSANIHIEPGSYLCIVPARWGARHEQLFLPFADKGDDKISEVISKILLLVNDDRITDQTILRQIRMHTAR